MTRPHRCGVPLLITALAACGGGFQSGRPTVGPSAGLAPEDRVVLSDFSYIQAVAASPWLVFAATPHGLLVYDRVARRFKPPVTALDGYPSGRVVRAVVDPAGNAVWLGLWGGVDYVRYDVDARVWTRGDVPSEQLAGVLTVEAALARAPLADALRAAILTDRRLRRHQFTAAAGTPERPELFFGTDGMGMVRVDRQTGEWDVLSYGLVAPAVGAVALAADGVWAAANARPGDRGRRGLTWVAADLSATRPAEGGGAALGFTFLSARRLLAAANALWLATEQGVLRIDPASWRSRLFDLPDATSLARAPDGAIWVGTSHGLSLVTTDERVLPFAPRGLPVTSLVAVRETLWVGTSDGLRQLLPGSRDLVMPAGLAVRPSLRGTVRALARLPNTIVMAMDREIVWRDASAWRTLPLP
ncbi:MAG: hypothetical protein ACREME_12100, partial [Gemmatimonadales bacterium]